MTEGPRQSRRFTGRPRRSRQTSRLVRVSDLTARVFITVGGLGTIIAVSLVGVFLVSVVIPLFLPARVSPRGAPIELREAMKAGTKAVHLAVDEYQTLALACDDAGAIFAFRYDTGEVVERRRLFEADEVTAWSFAIGTGEAAFGFRDGSIQFGTIGFVTRFLGEDEITEEMRRLSPGESTVAGATVVAAMADGGFREHSFHASLEDRVAMDAPAGIRLIDASTRPTGRIVAMVTEDGRFLIRQGVERTNLLTGEVTTTFIGGEIEVPRVEGREGGPARLLLSGVGDSAYLVWTDGHVIRLDTRTIRSPQVAEMRDLVPEPGETVTDLRFLLGKTSLVCGDSLGRIRVWFPVKPEGAETADGAVLAMAHDLRAEGVGAAVTTVGASARDRRIAVGYADGHAAVFYVTSERQLGEAINLGGTGGAALDIIALTAKDDGLAGIGDRALYRADLLAPYPEVSLSSISRPVWYEGYEKPAHVWQSSSGTDEFEPKLGLYPLVFGTIKATAYSMLFGVPLALLAAVYTSEFLHPRAKARIKPTIELMASLPSVVLGFLAALLFAPLIENAVPEVLCCVVTVPLAFLMGAFVWQMLPEPVGLRLVRYRFPVIGMCLPIGVAAAWAVGPMLEHTFFWIDAGDGQRVGDIRGWLSGQPGADGTGGWLLLLGPVAALAVAVVMARVVNPQVRRMCGDWSRARLATVDFARFLVGAGVTFAGAAAAAKAIVVLGFDPRGAFVDTYIQRNALVVGFVMGFAVIPIIYTIAEDALSAVPEHLRAASLGAGATHWQTAVRIIIPTAMSGLFSAVMIGFGRAVGETMIVLLAAGNTPIMEWNVFSGFRTLSANIAVEMPEAVKESTHYRMLFLAALVLFGMTFIVNTVAETVRQRFRRRAYQL